jgi:enoyl-CoA hydratase
MAAPQEKGRMTESPRTKSDVVLYDKRDDHVAVITLNRPEARNAISGAVALAIDSLVKQTEADDDVRVVILASSHERVFCAGADLGEISRGNAAALSTTDGGFGGLVTAARAKPWIAAVQGAALAGGCELALSCDMIVASQDARFGLPEVKRGLYAGAGGPYRLTRALPRNVALELIATGDSLDAERAYALGMVNRLAPPGAVLEQALTLAQVIAANAPLSVRESLIISRRALEFDEATFWTQSEETKDRVFSSEDAREGPLAFFEKREPRWVGR